MNINKYTFVYFASICGLFIIFFGIFYDQLGIPQICVVVLKLSLSIIFYSSFQAISNRVSLLLRSKPLHQTRDESQEDQIKSKHNNSKSNNNWKYRNIFFIKLILGVLFFFLLLIPLIYIFTVVHEFAHAITGLVTGVQIYKIRITGPREGFTDHSVLDSNFTMSLLSIAGIMGEIIFGIVLLVLLYRKKNMKLDVLIPIYCVIGYNFIHVYLYWETSLRMGIGDAASILYYNPGLSPQLLLIVGYIIFIVLIFYLILSLWRSINLRKNLFIKNYHPDIVDKKLSFIAKTLILKKT